MLTASCRNTLPGQALRASQGRIYTTGHAERRCVRVAGLCPNPLGGWGGRRSSPEGEQNRWEGGEPGLRPPGPLLPQTCLPAAPCSPWSRGTLSFTPGWPRAARPHSTLLLGPLHGSRSGPWTGEDTPPCRVPRTACRGPEGRKHSPNGRHPEL